MENLLEKKKKVNDFLEFLGFMGDSFMVVRGYFYRLDIVNGLSKNVKAKEHCFNSIEFIKESISRFSCTKKERKIIEKLEKELFVLKNYFDKNSLSKKLGNDDVPITRCFESLKIILIILEPD